MNEREVKLVQCLCLTSVGSLVYKYYVSRYLIQRLLHYLRIPTRIVANSRVFPKLSGTITISLPLKILRIKFNKRLMEKAIFAAGCFWGVEAAFRQVEGVTHTQVGYTGGHTENPTYEQVCSGKTGHAEAVQIEFDPSKVSYNDMLQVFWENHDPTTYHQQGPDIGEQYRSAIFYIDMEQRGTALVSLENLSISGKFEDPIVTEVKEATIFWPAEDYHQQYLEKRDLSTCKI